MKFMENWLRRIIREELIAFTERPPTSTGSFNIVSEAGGELIMPNPIREQFDEGKVTSIKDIL